MKKCLEISVFALLVLASADGFEVNYDPWSSNGSRGSPGAGRCRRSSAERRRRSGAEVVGAPVPDSIGRAAQAHFSKGQPYLP